MTNKQTLERDVLNAVHKYRQNARKGFVESFQAIILICCKYVQLPSCLKPASTEKHTNRKKIFNLFKIGA